MNKNNKNIIEAQKNLLNKPQVISENAQEKLEKAIQENDLFVFMTVLMRENIPALKLLALSIEDVHENTFEIILKKKMTQNGNNFHVKPAQKIQTVKISKESMRLLTMEIRKHSILAEKNKDTYNNPDNLIFTDPNGNFYKASYYVSKFKQLSNLVGFCVTPKLLYEFIYTQRDTNALEESKCKKIIVINKGKKYNYLTTSIKTKNGTRKIFAPSLEELQAKFAARKNPYAFRLKKNDMPFSEYCHNELNNLIHLKDSEKKKLKIILQNYLEDFCSKFTVNQIDDNFQAELARFLEERRCKLKAREQIVSLLRSVCNAALSKNFIRYNPFINVSLKADPVVKYHALSKLE